MAGVENKGFFQKSIEVAEKFSYATLALGLGAWALGTHLGLAWLATLGQGGVAIDAAQIIGLRIIRSLRGNKSAPAGV